MAAGSPGNPNYPYAGAHFALELGKEQDAGLFKSIEGGGVKTDVMTYQQGGNYDRWRQLGKVKFEDIKVQVGMSMTDIFYKWIDDFFAGTANRKDGAIVAADFFYNVRARREFKAAMIKELAFPKFEGKDNSPAYMTVTIAIEDMVFSAGDNKKMDQANIQAQKSWTSNNFHFTIDSFEATTDECVKVDGFTVKQNIIEYHSGGRRGPTLTPSAIDFPNLTFYIPEPHAKPLLDHYTKTGIRDAGSIAAAPKDYLNGSLVTFDNAKTEQFTLHFYNALILSAAPDKAESSTEDTKLIKFDLFVERMDFKNLRNTANGTPAASAKS